MSDLITKYEVWLEEIEQEEKKIIEKYEHVLAQKREIRSWIQELKGEENENN